MEIKKEKNIDEKKEKIIINELLSFLRKPLYYKKR